MTEEFLGDRKRVLEEEFFRKQEKALLERMRATQARQTKTQALAEASGIRDAAVLERLVDLGIEPDALLALGLVPLVEVAWADGDLDAREREAILAVLPTAGVRPDSPAHALVQGWLSARPPAAMREAWVAYTSGLSARLSPGERESLQTTVMQRARAVAEAAGGFLGLGSRVSRAEEERLRELARAFEGTSPTE